MMRSCENAGRLSIEETLSAALDAMPDFELNPARTFPNAPLISTCSARDAASVGDTGRKMFSRIGLTPSGSESKTISSDLARRVAPTTTPGFREGRIRRSRLGLYTFIALFVVRVGTGKGRSTWSRR